MMYIRKHLYDDGQVVIEEKTDYCHYGCIIAYDGLYYTEEMKVIGIDVI